jgi:hypothetical protein
MFIHRLAPSPYLLARHFFAVALYAIYIYWQKPQFVPIEGGSKIALRPPNLLHYPALFIRSLSVVCIFCGEHNDGSLTIDLFRIPLVLDGRRCFRSASLDRDSMVVEFRYISFHGYFR